MRCFHLALCRLCKAVVGFLGDGLHGEDVGEHDILDWLLHWELLTALKYSS